MSTFRMDAYGCSIVVEGMERGLLYFKKCKEIIIIMTNCQTYQALEKVLYDDTVQGMMKEALSKYNALAAWIGVKNIAPDIRAAARNAHNTIRQNGGLVDSFPDDTGRFDANGVAGEGAFVTMLKVGDPANPQA